MSLKDTVLDQFRPTMPLLVLPTVHLVLCFAADFSITDSESGWIWVLFFIADFPLSVLLRPLAFIDSLATYATFGTLWWYCIAVLVRYIARRTSVVNR